jgi:hypothetical protein
MSFVRFLAKESKYLYSSDIREVLLWVHGLFVKMDEERKRPRGPRPLLKVNERMGYNYIVLHMAMLSKNRQILTGPTNCRDYLNEAIRCRVSGTHSYNTDKDWPDKLDKKKLRLVLFLDNELVDGIEPLDGIKNGVRVANMYGRVAGWRPIHTCKAVIPDQTTDEEDAVKECYVLTGDGNWQRTPQYISMLVLLIRICLIHKVPEWITDAYSLTGYWEELINAPTSTHSDITLFLANSYRHMLVMVANDRKIFPHSIKGGFPKKGDGFHASSGINALVHDTSFHHKSAQLLKSYWKMEEPKYGGGN